MDSLTSEQIFVIVIFLILVISLFLYVKKLLSYNQLHDRYAGIIYIDEEIEKRKRKLAGLGNKYNELVGRYNDQYKSLKTDYQSKRNIYEQLLEEINTVEEKLEFTTYGIYEPHFGFDTSTKYKLNLEKIRTEQKRTIKENTAVFSATEWSVGGSIREGQKMTNQYMKLMLRAFNNECDAAVLKVKWNNVFIMEERINRAFNAINKLGTIHSIEIANEYLNLKLDELHLAHEYQEKLYEEKEEQRRIKEQMREEEKVRREIEKATKEAEDEEKSYQKALVEAKKQLEKAKGEELEKLNEEILLLQEQLHEAEQKKERALSRAQLTRSGHVYVISNVGSFGENIYKIGLTRRLEPINRVKELGDASVPFSFDIHAMIYSENAPELENELHRLFDGQRVNMMNTRKEFFRVALDQIEKAVKARNSEIEFTKVAEAREYRETVALLDAQENIKPLHETIEEEFPSALI